MPLITKRVDKLRAIELKTKGATYTDIAAVQGVSRQAICKAIKDLLPTAETEEYKNHRADILAQLQCKIIKSIDDSDIKKSPMGSRILAIAQLVDKERLERGQSTDNVSVLVAGLKEMQAARWGKSVDNSDAGK